MWWLFDLSRGYNNKKNMTKKMIFCSGSKFAAILCALFTVIADGSLSIISFEWCELQVANGVLVTLKKH